MSEEYSDSRRRFLGYAIGGIAGAVVIGYAVPLANYIIRPSLKKSEEAWSKVGSVEDLKVDEPKTLTFSAQTKVGWVSEKAEHDVWAVRRADGSVTVFSPVCPHLGCGYRWNPVTSHFECPCHASFYDINGKVLGGPAPRDLDTLPSKVENGLLYVVFEKFRLGVHDKIVA